MKMRLPIGQAKLQGFIVDTTTYPHFGYKGPRFSPTERVQVFTKLESGLLGVLEGVGVDIKKLIKNIYNMKNIVKRRNMKTKIVCISDTHGEELNIKLPKCDIFIHCGDSYIASLTRLNVVNDWLGTIDARHRIIIAGNHDVYLQKIGKELCEQLFTNALYLQNRGTEIRGLRIWGSPHTPEFMSWAFMYPRLSLEAKRIWEQIPENLDILITHGPAYRTLDYSNYENEGVGCEVLQREVFKKKPKYHLFGHIHEAHGHTEKEGIKFYNVSVLDGDYKLVYDPTILEI